MPHLDDEQLTLIAFGESPGADAEAHVVVCARCRAEIDELRYAHAVGRASIDYSFDTPPDRVWQHIADDLRLGEEARRMGQDAGTEQVDVDRRPGGRDVLYGGISVAIASVVGAAAFAVSQVVPSTAPDTRIAAAELLTSSTAQPIGRAVVDVRADGSRELTVSMRPVPAVGHHEVWLMTPDAGELLSIGLLTGTSASFALPADIDLARFSMVDVSDEQADGDPGHSGDSVASGVLLPQRGVS